MSNREPEFLYKKFFENIDFERLELFKCIKKEFKPETVIYIGSSIHITPSFVFQNVTYIDKSSMSKEFFDDIDGVKSIIDRNKNYKCKPFVDFYHIDYLSENFNSRYKFDLCVSLFTSNSLKGIDRYLKPGGILIFLSLNGEIIRDEEHFELIGYITFNKGYCFNRGKTPEKVPKLVSGNTIFRESNIYNVYIKK